MEQQILCVLLEPLPQDPGACPPSCPECCLLMAYNWVPPQGLPFGKGCCLTQDYNSFPRNSLHLMTGQCGGTKDWPPCSMQDIFAGPPHLWSYLEGWLGPLCYCIKVQFYPLPRPAFLTPVQWCSPEHSWLTTYMKIYPRRSLPLLPPSLGPESWLWSSNGYQLLYVKMLRSLFFF